MSRRGRRGCGRSESRNRQASEVDSDAYREMADGVARKRRRSSERRPLAGSDNECTRATNDTVEFCRL